MAKRAVGVGVIAVLVAYENVHGLKQFGIFDSGLAEVAVVGEVAAAANSNECTRQPPFVSRQSSDSES